MTRLKVSTFLTLDGVMQAPGDAGEFERGGWQLPSFDEGAGAIAKEGLFASDALLLGRVTYEHFAAAWPGMTDEEGFAERMNSIPKFVASTTLADAEWNATVIRDPAAEVPRLKEQHDLLVMGSGRLVQALREHDLVDEYEIWIHPILLGAGKRLFEETAETTTLALTGTKTTDKGITVLTYDVER
jgi:dihydrofolate reductase